MYCIIIGAYVYSMWVEWYLHVYIRGSRRSGCFSNISLKFSTGRSFLGLFLKRANRSDPLKLKWKTKADEPVTEGLTTVTANLCTWAAHMRFSRKQRLASTGGKNVVNFCSAARLLSWVRLSQRLKRQPKGNRMSSRTNSSTRSIAWLHRP